MIARADSLVSSSTTSNQNHRINTLSDFLNALETNMISKVVFNGINPQSATVYFKEGGDIEVFNKDNGFPYYDDPRSPAGPTQLIAKVQHTPGVVCLQDISSVMAKRGSGAISSSSSLNGSKQQMSPSKSSYVNTLLSHSAYPNNYAYSKGTVTYGEQGIGESEQFLKRYSSSASK